MKAVTIKTIAYFVLILLLGFVIGFYVNQQLTHKRLMHLRKNFNKPGTELRMLAKRLDLTPKQVEQMKPILRKHLPGQLATRKEHRKEMDSLRTEMFNELQPFLTREQIRKVEQMKKERPPHHRKPMP